jgi:L,D-peptidoglycan transpeptidase YkuD (ErfK/YbiS/YcfS/YnhG family)
LVPINYNTNPVVPYKGSVIFLHLTQNYKPTAGCIAISIKDFLTLAKYVKSSDKIKIG